MPTRDISAIIIPLRQALDALLELQKTLGIARATPAIDPTRHHGLRLNANIDQPPLAGVNPAQLPADLQHIAADLEQLQSGHDRFCCKCLRSIPAEHWRDDPEPWFCIDCLRTAARPRPHPTWY
jgi:hypothetical protein